MGDMLSQAEIDALLNGGSSSESDTSTSANEVEGLSTQEIDALGEVGNISMGTSATTLFTLLGQKVLITTPKVSVITWEEVVKSYELPFVAVKVEYTHGLIGTNLLVLKENDVKIITDLMMGGDGANLDGELTDLHLSAIGEAMNQMVGSSSTSMSSMFDKRIDISPPKAYSITSNSSLPFEDFDSKQKLVKTSFRMEIGSLIDSEIMQLLPISFAKGLVDNLLNVDMGGQSDSKNASQAMSQPQQDYPQQGRSNNEQSYSQPMQQDYNQMDMGHVQQNMNRGPINVQPAQFQSFDDSRIMLEKKNISIIMDVPLEVTVELGRTHRLIKDILEFGPGSIIELDKLAGEPVDILVNGKAIAKGEVVVIDESFGVRITDIIHPSKRL